VQCFFAGNAWDAFAIPDQCKQSPAPLTGARIADISADRHKQWSRGLLAVPKVDQSCSYKIKWASTIAGREYSYAHYEYYDIKCQRHRDNQLDDMCSIVATTVELGGSKKEAYHYDGKTLECSKYPFTAPISQFILTYPQMNLAATEMANGVLCDKWALTFPPSPATAIALTVAVWFKVKSSVPVKLYNSNDELNNITHGGFRDISYYSDSVADNAFAVPTGCGSSSSSIMPAEQAAWTSLYDGTGGATQWTNCGCNRLDPCGCRYIDQYKAIRGVQCSGDRKHILKL
jgi:hypothetical protein